MHIFIMQDEEKLDILDQLIDKELSMDEAITLTKTLKQQWIMRDTFVAEVGLTSWDEAVTVLPQFTECIHMYKEKEDAFKVTYLLCSRPQIPLAHVITITYTTLDGIVILWLVVIPWWQKV